jgi:hypothetical protein
MGVTILNGALSTFVSSLFLFNANIIIFYKFAVMLSTTICVAFFTSMFFFGSACHIFGP